MSDYHSNAVTILNNLTNDQQIRAKAIEISANIYASCMLAAALTNDERRVPPSGNPFLIARKIESYIRNDIISDSTQYFWWDKS